MQIKYFSSIRRLFSREKKQFVYVALGDSTVEGYGATKPERGYAGIVYHALKETYPGALFYNLGKANATAADVLQKQIPKALDLHPNLVTISIGGNDVRFRTHPKRFEKYLTTILELLTQKTRANIVINTIPDFSLLPAVPKYLRIISRLMVWQLNKKIRCAAESYQIIFVDLFKQGKIFTKHFPEVVFEDGFHPSDFGYALWANTILAHMQHMLRRSTTYL